MAPVQNTFSIIPDLPSAINGNRHGSADGSNAHTSRPPMTTKQVKKAYQKANKGPKLSKAEQRRQELFEQDRIRKEFEKEKNQARARATRDKKKEREERERAAKKKKGLPLVDVRPSQDTIARFVRAKINNQRDGSAPPLREDEVITRSVSPIVHDAGKPRQFDIEDKENVRHSQKRSYAVPVDTSHGLYDTSPTLDHAEPLDKKRRVEGEGDQVSLPIVDGVTSPSPKHDPTASAVSDRVQGMPSPNMKQSGPSVDDSFSTIDLSEENCIGDLLSEMNDASNSPNALEESLSGQQRGQGPPIQCPPPKPPEDPELFPNKTGIPPSYLELAAEPTGSPSPPKLVHSPKLVPDIGKTLRQNPIPEPAKEGSTPHSFAAPPRPSAQKLQPNFPSSRSFRYPTTPMALSPIPPKFKLSGQVATGGPSTPHFLKPPLPPPRTAIGASYHSRMAGPKQVRDNELPPSTQLFLLSHLDDFLPSPSQEAREIFEEPQKNHTRTVNPTKLTAKHTGNDSKSKQYMSRMSTTSCNTGVNSTPSFNSGGSRHIQQTANRPKPSKAAIRTPLQPIPQHTPSAFDIPFFSTQDLVLSSQDVKDIEEEPVSSPQVHNPTPIPTKDCVKPRDALRRSPKPFFTSTCRELRYKYALERSRTAAWEGPNARQKAREELDRLQALEDERLEALLANPSEETKHENTRITVVEVEPDAGWKGPLTAPSRRTPTPQAQSRRAGSGRHSYSISDDTAQKHTRKFPDVQKTRLGSGSSSYEAMLELLAKAPKQKPDAHVTKRGTDGDGDKDRSSRHANSDLQTKASSSSQAMMTTTTISASQETDYDGGVDWDDDDLLCDMI
ncbi:hypothetical protein F4782DRAFT_315959 [Xylaria castorea]|nr:hypothetical protein F4782DRAFT_315959 [Xylaria castorea]